MYYLEIPEHVTKLLYNSASSSVYSEADAVKLTERYHSYTSAISGRSFNGILESIMLHDDKKTVTIRLWDENIEPLELKGHFDEILSKEVILEDIVDISSLAEINVNSAHTNHNF